MAPTTLTERSTTAEAAPRVGVRWSSVPLIQGLASALLLWLAFPPVGAWFLAWIAPALLFGLIRSQRPRLSVYAGAWVGGAVYWLLSIQWVRLTDETAWLAWLVMGLFLSLWWLVFLALARLAVLRMKLPLMVAAPILWVGLEHFRAYVLTGFPWYYLAHSQYAIAPLVQVADFSGALGLSWLIALVNAWWVDVFTLPLFRPTPAGPRLARPQVVRGSVVSGAILATLVYGVYRLGSAEFRIGPTIGLLQSNMIQRVKMHAPEREIEDTFHRLMTRAMEQTPRPDLVVWPETSYPYAGFSIVSPELSAQRFDQLVTEFDERKGAPDTWRETIDLLSRHLHGWSDDFGVSMLVGTTLHEFAPSGHSRFNSAVLFEPRVPTIQAYHKLHLVPFGEYVPLIDYFPWLQALTPYRGRNKVPSLTFGREPVWLQLGPYRIATAICFEDTVPHVVRRFFAEAPDAKQPDILINMSNDGWFHGSAEHDMHLAVSVFRAIENRVPLVRAVNTGITAVIDGNGRIIDQIPKLKEGILVRQIQLDDRVSFYSARGDWLGLSCLAVAIGLLPLSLIRKTRTVHPS
jgi:apolipoprotein N-acyltransferase